MAPADTKHAEVMHQWYKELLHVAVPPLIRKWEPKLGVQVHGFHEKVQLLEPTHSDRFPAILDKHYPTWRAARAELNELPLAAENWNLP